MALEKRNWTAGTVLKRMESMGSARNRNGKEHFGIRADRAYGVATPQLRALAREIGRNHALALELWDSGMHEARHVAAWIADPAECSGALMERWARGFDSWDIVDGTCRYFFLYSPHAWEKAFAWSTRRSEFVRRAAFSLMAALAVHDKKAGDEEFRRLLPVILEAATDERNFVRKAVNWALRQIGKRNRNLNGLAVETALLMQAIDSRAARWIAADALRELRGAAVQARLGAADFPTRVVSEYARRRPRTVSATH